MAMLAAMEMFGRAMKWVQIKMNSVLVAPEDIPVVFSSWILNNHVLVLGISILVNLVKRDGPFRGWFLLRLLSMAVLGTL
jgi:hypothetical protein